MDVEPTGNYPIVSVIISCYNHGQYLETAIESVLSQNYPCTEIIVVDDGSTDNTKQIATSYSEVIYVYQQNQGLSSARNTGIDHCKGAYIVFLDADDWLLKDALTINLHYLIQDQHAVFVFGAHIKVIEDSNLIEEKKIVVDADHYQTFLKQGNYIGMHATVMYRRNAFDKLRFDVSLAACEDYDVYLKLSRNGRVIHHQQIIAAYRIHKYNMSSKIPLMLGSALRVLKKQKANLKNKQELKCYKTGISYWKKYYTYDLYWTLAQHEWSDLKNKKVELRLLINFNFPLYIKLLLKKVYMSVKAQLKKLLIKSGIYKTSPAVNKINFGDFNRTTPFSTEFGYDRGGPVDRYYIENFLEKYKEDVKGEVLEIGDNDYTLRFGASKISKSHILHVDENNPAATYVGDLSDAPHVPDNAFDCIILTQTIHLIYHYNKAIETCYRILKPGGVLLLTVPGISNIDYTDWGHLWLWAFTDSSIKRILGEVFEEGKYTTEVHGNVLVATAFLYGMGLPEISKKVMDDCDPHYQVIITARAVK